jgi:hypothetical protein
MEKLIFKFSASFKFKSVKNLKLATQKSLISWQLITFG